MKHIKCVWCGKPFKKEYGYSWHLALKHNYAIMNKKPSLLNEDNERKVNEKIQ
jgi:uncharacterized C2H2 Zn-finger protein